MFTSRISRRSSLGALLLTTLSLSGLFGSSTAHARERHAQVRYDFVVHVVSGTREGERWPGSVVVDKARLPSSGTAVVDALDFQFDYAGHRLRSADLDGPAQVRFVRGRPVELIAVGGPQTLRFGFSAGFERGQFGRAEEAFITRGQPYFGYLDPHTYVDGAGVVSFGQDVARGAKVVHAAPRRQLR